MDASLSKHSMKGRLIVKPSEGFDTSDVASSHRVKSTSMEPPPRPSSWTILKILVWKHFFIAKKRHRILTCLWAPVLFSGLACALFSMFTKVNNPAVRAVLLAILLPTELMPGIMGTMNTAIVEVVSEKESKMKVIQSIYGLTTRMYWLSWGVYFFTLSILCVIVNFFFFYGVQPVFSEAKPELVFIILVCAYIQQFLFAAIIAIFFDSVQSASAAATFFNLLMTGIATGTQSWMQGRSNALWYMVSLFPGVNVFNGLSAIMWAQVTYTCSGDSCYTGLDWDNLFEDKYCYVTYSLKKGCPKGAYKELFPFGNTILMIVVDVALYTFLAWWLEHVWQGEYGAAKPLTFCCNPKYMCPRRRDTCRKNGDGHGLTGKVVAMSINQLRKKFKKKVAVEDLTLDVFAGEIFALLGHNGAGKTTAINCVVGLIPLTGGTAIVNGFDVTTDMDNVRRQLSICPQDNPFYDVFTVRQHLLFFATLRGVSEVQLEDCMGNVLSALGMLDKVDDLCKNLSGGQKRRLWVATALVGQSPIVFMDEPTSGMDPSSRRELWDLLLAMKADGRTIIFTTHYLEEADVLADRKAVLARGKVQALGTSRDLKMHYGLGYHMCVELPSGSSDEHVADIGDLVMQHVPTAQVENAPPEERGQAADSANFARFTLPYSEVSRFGPLLSELDSMKAQTPPLVQNYSIAMTSLEEVFMRLGKEAEEEAGTNDNADFREVGMEVPQDSSREETSLARGAKAMFRIRMLKLVGNKRTFTAMFIVPVLLQLLGCGFRYSKSGSSHFLSVAIYAPMAFGIGILPLTFILIKDRDSKIKHVCISQGLSIKSYWAGNFAACFFGTSILCVFFFGVVHYTSSLDITGPGSILFLVQLLVYPIGLILYAFNMSVICPTIEFAGRFLPLMNMFVGTIPTVLVCHLWELEDPAPAIAKSIHVVMSFTNPVYALPGLMITMGLSAQHGELYSASSYFVSLCALPLYGAVVVVIIYGGNLYYQDSRSYSSKPGEQRPDVDVSRKDQDVLAEEARIASISDPLMLAAEAVNYHGLHHTYESNIGGNLAQNVAVRGISLGIQRGECLGLLGPNGAGKTTTLAVLTGEVRPPTSGRVTIYGHDMSSAQGMQAAYELLGVCPQVDPIWDTVTGREHLLFYGRIKGIPEVELHHKVDRVLYRLGLDVADGNKPAGQYSGGMKRKLSVGIALIGQSSVMLLDEPSAAVDVSAKRHLWKVIKRRAPDQTVVLTTHSMEEAEALCDRIAIQVKGQLRCIGTPNHIKDLYGSGYQLEVFCQSLTCCSSSEADAHREQLTQLMQEKLSRHTELLECHSGRYLFQLPSMGQCADSLTLGKVFSELNLLKEQCGITDYSIAQPSLEQVFIHFAREQEEAEDVKLQQAKKIESSWFRLKRLPYLRRLFLHPFYSYDEKHH